MVDCDGREIVNVHIEYSKVLITLMFGSLYVLRGLCLFAEATPEEYH